MKQLLNKDYIPSVLLVSYLVYCSFIPITTPHSIILCSLAALFGYQQYLLRHDHTSKLEKDVAQLKSNLEQELRQQKELHEVSLKEMKEEVSKVSLTLVQRASPSPSSKTDKKIIF